MKAYICKGQRIKQIHSRTFLKLCYKYGVVHSFYGANGGQVFYVHSKDKTRIHSLLLSEREPYYGVGTETENWE